MRDYLESLCRRSLKTFWEVARIMVPIMILMRVAEAYGLIEWMSPIFRPVMGVLSLPPEAAIIAVTSIFTGMYGAIATLPVLIGQDMTAAQVTSVCAFILIAHGLPVEQAIVHRAGGSFWGTSLLRVFAACLAVILIDLVSKTTGFLAEPQSLEHFRQFARTDAGHLDWALSSLKGLLVLFTILVALLIMMDVFDRIGLTALINRLLAPVLGSFCHLNHHNGCIAGTVLWKRNDHRTRGRSVDLSRGQVLCAVLVIALPRLDRGCGDYGGCGRGFLDAFVWTARPDAGPRAGIDDLAPLARDQVCPRVSRKT